MPKYQFTREVTATSQVFREADSDDLELPAASVYADTGLGVARDAAGAALLVLTVLVAHLIGWH